MKFIHYTTLCSLLSARKPQPASTDASDGTLTTQPEEDTK